MPELLISVSGKDPKTTADANGRGQREKATRQARIRARVESGFPRMTMHLRSINVTLDSATPQRIAHFFPTAKSARLLRSWLHPDQSSSYFVVAPYGTGKSLTATFFIQIVENLEESSEVLDRISERFSKIDGELANELRSRIGSEQMPLFGRKGATVALSGFQPHLPTAIQHSLIASLKRTGNKNAASLATRRTVTSMDDLVALLSVVRNRYCPDPIDRLAIVWDEFGRHLEELIIRGTASDLSDVQTLAEFCARTKRAPMTLALLLHQGLIRYANNTSVTVQREWKKIEGRFETVQSSTTARSCTSWSARLCVSSDHPSHRREIWSNGVCRGAVRSAFSVTSRWRDGAHALGLLSAGADDPVPAAAGSSRVAQNERTLFTYLNSIDASAPVSPDSLYDYFSDAMRADTLPGGSCHTWLETESALHKARGGDEKTLKCASLLGLGLVGERSRVSRRLLECAVSGYREDKASRDSVKRLIDAKTAALPAQRRQCLHLAWHRPRSSRASRSGEGAVGTALRPCLVPDVGGATRPVETNRLQRRIRDRTILRHSLRRRRGHHHGRQRC